MKKALIVFAAVATTFGISSGSIAMAAGLQIPARPHPSKHAPESATPADASPSKVEPNPKDAADSLDRSDDNGPTPPGVPVRQPAQPEGGKDLLQTSAGKPPVPPRFALTLAGGGARGAAHIGVLKKLEAEGLRPDFIAGSSIGACIGALYAGGVPISEIERMALDGRLQKAFFPIPFGLKVAEFLPVYTVKRIFHIKPIPALYSGKSIARFIHQSLPPNEKNVEDLPIRFAAISTNITDSRPFWITKGDIGAAVRASCAVPGLYQPVDTGERLLIDGGLRANLPTEVAKAVGAPVVVGVRLHSLLEAQPKKHYGSIVRYGERVTSIFMSEIETKAMDEADVVISPDVGDISVASFGSAELAKGIQVGEEAAAKAIPKIKDLIRRKEGTAAGAEPLPQL